MQNVIVNIIHGPQGSGKTRLARTLAKEIGTYAVGQGRLVVDQPETIQFPADIKAVVIEDMPFLSNQQWAAVLATVLSWELPVMICTQQAMDPELVRFVNKDLQGVYFKDLTNSRLEDTPLDRVVL